MGLFDFLFGSDESSTKQWGPRKFLILGERRNGGKLNSRREFLLASPFRRDRRHRASGSGNWTSREDWDCGDYDNDGMSGWDSYEDNDF